MKARARFRLVLVIVVLALLPGRRPAQAAAPPENSPDTVVAAIGHLRNLEYDAAKQQLRGWLEEHPADLYAWNYLAVAILYQEMFQRGVLESGVYGHGGDVFKPSKVPVTAAFQQELFSVLDRAQQLADERLKKDAGDKAALYWAGVTHGTRATYHFTLRKEYMPALHEASDAYKHHRNLLKLDPGYVDAYLLVGMNNYVVGSLPWYIKMLAALTGRHGNRAQGMAQVKRVTEEGHYAREDAKLMLAVLYQREKMYSQALPLYQEMSLRSPRNYLLRYEVAELFSLMKDWRSAAQGYDGLVARHRAREAGYQPIPLAKVLYRSGQAREQLHENDAALARYEEAGLLNGDDPYIFRSELAAADLEVRRQRPQEARRYYQRVADAAPNTDYGVLARRALKQLPSN